MSVMEFFKNRTKREILLAALAGISLLLSLLGILRGILPFDIAWVSIILCGLPILFFAAYNLIRFRDITADVLVSAAFIASIVLGEYFAAGEVVWIMAVGKLLEDWTSTKAKKNIEKLIEITPRTARVQKRDGSQIVPISGVRAGDILVVFAGEMIPVDGILTSGNTSVDQSNMTGESVPVDKAPGDQVISGTINQSAPFEMEAEKNGEDSTLQRMVKLAGEADANKAPIVGLANRWAVWLVAIAFTTAALVWFLTGEAMRAVTVLVVFCPCAFVLATPTAVMAGIANVTKHGILVRSGEALQRFSKVDTIVFDKTGTLTKGKPAVKEIKSLTSEFSADDLLRLAASAEQRSEHPLGKAIVESLIEKGGTVSRLDSYESTFGMGVKASVESRKVIIGKAELMRSSSITVDDRAEKLLIGYGEKGLTSVFLAVDGNVVGIIALGDVLREGAKETISILKEKGIETVLLTGDNELAARSIASSLGIVAVQANVLPEGKMEAISEYKSRGKKVLMVGDGVNDTLALKSAYASIAIGGIGSDIVVEASDAVLVSESLKQIPYLLSLSKKTMKRIVFDIAFGMFWNAIAVALSVMGILNPVLAAIVHNAGSVFVVISSALLLVSKEHEKGHAR